MNAPEPTTQTEALAEYPDVLHEDVPAKVDWWWTPEGRAAHDAVVAAEAKAAGLREAADEVQIERRWQTELTMRGVPETDITHRLGVIEQVFRDRAARIEAQ